MVVLEKASAGPEGFTGAYRVFQGNLLSYSNGIGNLPRFSMKLEFVQYWCRKATAFCNKTSFCTVPELKSYRVFQENLLLYSRGAEKLPRFPMKLAFVQ